ncbi:cytochrome ubiquinol oxidase subunit I [Salinicoccus roseus]|uniref:cytochrome ubiquinol oxidase subunit I n=1 Tax=Salinicoccus roseus TaxID=45670 RepID=UPI0023001179|nr:cytochrome ubiquinol oxidase subunit I [Salinicoccus roseus]
MDEVIIGRVLTASTLGFHIIFATIGVGIPIVFMVLEFLGLRNKDAMYLTMARRIAKGYTVTVAVGVVTGTIIGLQLSLIWPDFMRLGGQIIALPLFMETFAFFFEAIFLGIFLYTWDRFKNPWHHWLLNIPIVIGSTLSAVFITTVNSFMNTPAGFDLVDGALVNVDPLAAMFNPSSWVRIFHVVVTAYMTAVFIIASIGAFKLLRSKFKEDREYHKKGLKVMMVLGLVMASLTVLAGDFSAKFLHEHQPEKLAAMEWHFETEDNADLVLFGVLDEETQEVSYAIKIPSVLSFLAGNSFDTEVTGLNDIPEDEHPPLIIHYFFDMMVFFGMYGLTVALIYFLAKFSKFDEHHPALLYAYVLTGPLSMAAIESGWFLAEMGRQPWILRGYMRVSEAVTNADGLGLTLIAFVLLYAVLGVTCIYVLLKMFQGKSADTERLEMYGEDYKGGRLP